MTGPAPLFCLRGVGRSYRAPRDAREGRFLLDIPVFRLAVGERVVVVGPSGSGKSTLLDLLAFLAPPQDAVEFTFHRDGAAHDVAALWGSKRRRRLSALRARNVGYVLQTGGLLPYLDVQENILLSRRLLGLAIPGPLRGLAERLGLGGLLRRRPAELSVGQRQRVAVARALAHAPALVLADEPTAALDAGLARDVMDALLDATAESGGALVLVTHEEAIAARAGGRIVPCRPVAGQALARSVIEG